MKQQDVHSDVQIKDLETQGDISGKPKLDGDFSRSMATQVVQTCKGQFLAQGLPGGVVNPFIIPCQPFNRFDNEGDLAATTIISQLYDIATLAIIKYDDGLLLFEDRDGVKAVLSPVSAVQWTTSGGATVGTKEHYVLPPGIAKILVEHNTIPVDGSYHITRHVLKT